MFHHILHQGGKARLNEPGYDGRQIDSQSAEVQQMGSCQTKWTRSNQLKQFVILLVVLGLSISSFGAQTLSDDQGHGICPSGQAPVRDPVRESIVLGSLSIVVSPVVTLPDVVVGDETRHARLMMMTGDGRGRRFVVDMNGIIYQIFPDDSFAVYLDVRNHPRFTIKNEPKQAGLRAFAFHPDFYTPGAPGEGKLYTAMAVVADKTADFPLPKRAPVASNIRAGVVHHQTVIHEWTALHADAIDVSSDRELMRIDQYGSDHNVGLIGFNPNVSSGDLDYGLLYIAMANGGNTKPIGFQAMDPYLTGQDLNSPLSAILRIDPLGHNSVNGRYGIPSHNPFVRDGNPHPLGEIWAKGLRNPDSWSFDTRGDGTFFVGDIGQKAVEEINIGIAGGNYGWANRQGNFASNRCDLGDPQYNEMILWPLPADDAGYVYPVISIDRDEAEAGPRAGGKKLAIIGGYVYRGSRVPQLYGKYIFGILATGRIFYAEAKDLKLNTSTTPKEFTLIDATDRQQKSFLAILGIDPLRAQPFKRVDLRFGTDDNGEIYLLSKQDGTIRRITAALSRSPMAHWLFNQDSRDTVGRNNATLKHGVRFTTEAVEGSHALQLDGNTDGVLLAESADSGFLHNAFPEHTVAMWIKAKTASGIHMIFNEGGPSRGLHIRINNNTLEAQVSQQGSSQFIHVQTPFTSTAWTHVATVFDRGNLRLYLNGQRQSVHQRRVGTPFSVVDAHRGTAVLGARSRTDVWQSGSTEDNFDGLIDDVRVYDVALSDAEITLLTVVSPHAAARSTDP